MAEKKAPAKPKQRPLTKADRWLADNRPALESSNQWVAKHGLPLERYRAF